jgi:sigma-B regulation protein RsbU (phosphoserine phosphatase)
VTDKPKGMIFDSFDLRVLSTVANQVAETYDNIIHEKKSIEREKLQKELDIASDIQYMYLSPIPQIKECEIGAFTIPASIVGGDFYECTVLDEKNILLTMGDVSGKGVPAALYMNGIRNSIRYSALNYKGHIAMVKTINDWAYRESKNGMFCTMAQSYIDLEKKEITYYSAGHNDQLFYQKKDDMFIAVNARGKPLGINIEEDYIPSRIQYSSGDMLLLFTDGLIDDFVDNVSLQKNL